MAAFAPAHPTPAAVTPPIGSRLVEVLRARIVRGELAPGARLTEAEIADAYHMSRQPVREAFIRLAGEALLEVRPQRGTFVRRISTADVTAGRFVREAVEGDIVRQAAGRASPAALARLRGLVAEQRAVAGEGAAAFMALDESFHRALAGIAGQGRAWRHLQPVKSQMDRVRHLTACEFPTGSLVAQHAAVVAALERADPDAAEQAMRAHLRRVLEDLPGIVAAEPDFFEIDTDGDAATDHPH